MAVHQLTDKIIQKIGVYIVYHSIPYYTVSPISRPTQFDIVREEYIPLYTCVRASLRLELAGLFIS